MKVTYTKEFVTGNLKGLMFDTAVGVPDLEHACRLVAWCHMHKLVAVQSIDGCDYIIHMATIKSE